MSCSRRPGDLPDAVDPVEHPKLGVAILTGVAADLIECHPSRVPSIATLAFS